MNSANVSAAKPKVGGAMFVAPLGTLLPTTAVAELSVTFKELGYVSEDGVKNANSPESEEVKAWGGDVVLTPVTGRPDTWTVKLIECTNPDVLKLIYGDSKVTGTFATGIAVSASAGDLESHAYVFDMAIKGGLKRITIPDGKVTEVSEITYKDNEPIGYELTLKCSADSVGNTHYEYIKQNTTTGSGGSST